jgi:hypothetical protein
MFKKLILDKKSPIKASSIAYRLSPKNWPTHPHMEDTLSHGEGRWGKGGV